MSLSSVSSLIYNNASYSGEKPQIIVCPIIDVAMLELVVITHFSPHVGHSRDSENLSVTLPTSYIEPDDSDVHNDG